MWTVSESSKYIHAFIFVHQFYWFSGCNSRKRKITKIVSFFHFFGDFSLLFKHFSSSFCAYIVRKIFESVLHLWTQQCSPIGSQLEIFCPAKLDPSVASLINFIIDIFKNSFWKNSVFQFLVFQYYFTLLTLVFQLKHKTLNSVSTLRMQIKTPMQIKDFFNFFQIADALLS